LLHSNGFSKQAAKLDHLRLSSDVCSLWLFDRLLQLVFPQEKGMEQTNPHGKQRPFTRDDVARISASAINTVVLATWYIRS